MKTKGWLGLWAAWALFWGLILSLICWYKVAEEKKFLAEARPASGRVVQVDSESRREKAGGMARDVLYWRMVVDYELDGEKRTLRTPLGKKMPEAMTGDPVELLVDARSGKAMLKEDVGRKSDWRFFLVGWIFMSVFPLAGLASLVPVLLILGKALSPILARVNVRLASRPPPSDDQGA